MGEAGHLNNIPHTLCHLDLYPRNMIISVKPLTNEPTIERMLDLDSALLAPAFMIGEPPVYLWNSRHVNFSFDPITEEDKEVKRISEEATGEEYVRFAYNPVYRFG
ncbi:hypothetical protein QBC36DRAFT_145473, partial [Triangularia setosa]